MPLGALVVLLLLAGGIWLGGHPDYLPNKVRDTLVGALGGILAILLLGVVKIALVDPLAAQFALIAAPDTINFGLLIAVLLAASVGVSAIGSGLSLRRFLRV